MRVGLLYPAEDRKKLDSELESGKAVIGVAAEEFYNTLNMLEIQHITADGSRAPELIIAELKKQLMISTGRLQLRPVEEEEKEEVTADGIPGKAE